MRVRKSKTEVSRRLRMYDSLNEYYKVMLCDFGITFSPTVATEQELGYYLLNEFRLHKIKSYRSERTSVPFILDIDYLEYIKNTVDEEDSFNEGLEYVIGYLKTKAEINALYEFDSHLNTDDGSKIESKTYELRKIKQTDEFGRNKFTVRDIVSPYNSVQGLLEIEVPITDIYYNYFEQETGFKGVKNWTFFKGYTRKEEANLLRLVFEGHLKPTSFFVEKYWGIYLSRVLEFGVCVYKDLEMFIDRAQEGAFNAYVSPYSEYELKYKNSYMVGFAKKYNYRREYPVYLTSIAWDAVQKKPLPVVNQLEGIGGEFVYQRVNDDDRPFEVTFHDGSKVIMYKVDRYSRLTAGQLNLHEYYKELSYSSYGVGQINDKKLFEVDENNYSMLRIGLSNLVSKGVYCVN